MKRALIASTIIALIACQHALGQSEADVVVLPFENLSRMDEAGHDVSFLVIGAFTRKGWSVASPVALDDILRSERVRYLDFLEDASRTRILQDTNSRGVVTGTVYEYSEGRYPTVAVAARLVTPAGTLAWSNVAVVSSLETEGLFGFGRRSTVHEVAVAAVEELTASLRKPEEELRPTPGPGKPVFTRSPTVWVAQDALGSAPGIVGVLPFVNASRSPHAARVLTDLVTLRLAAARGLSTVDSAKLRLAALELGLGSFRQTQPEDLDALATFLGTPLLLRGTVYEFGYETGRAGDPIVSVELSLVDTRTDRVVWVAQAERRGSDYEGLFLLGAEVSAVGLADRVVSDLIEAAEDALGNGERMESAGLRARRREDLKGEVPEGASSQTGGSP